MESEQHIITLAFPLEVLPSAPDAAGRAEGWQVVLSIDGVAVGVPLRQGPGGGQTAILEVTGPITTQVGGNQRGGAPADPILTGIPLDRAAIRAAHAAVRAQRPVPAESERAPDA